MNDQKNTKGLIKTELTKLLGVTTEDINDDDSLVTDLHLKPTDITDLLEALSQNGLDTSRVDFEEVDTVSELADALES